VIATFVGNGSYDVLLVDAQTALFTQF